MLESILLALTLLRPPTPLLIPAPLRARVGTIACATYDFKRLSSSPRPDLPVLLFLPGIDGSGRAGLTQWPRLESNYEVHALSLTPDDRSSLRAPRESPT